MKSQKSNSAIKRLIPAAAMLAASMTMLSTATYAWFTMNKEVQMTGLEMTATASEGIEISLASVTGDNNTINWTGNTYYDGSHPKDTESEKGWKSSVVVSDYYSDIGKLKPASSANGTEFFNAKDASNRGTEASQFTAITLADNMSKYTTRASLPASGASSAITSNGDAGFYFDIPVHIRTTRAAAAGDSSGDIYCKLDIKNATENNTNAELYKAIRVAFIPASGDTSSTTAIFGADSTYFNNRVVGTGAVLTSSANVTNTAATTSDAGVKSGLVLPYAAAAGGYGHLDFTVRVWIEGQSTFCYDNNAGQSWNINLSFSLGEFDTSSNTST